jgi:hypothetical protein
MFPYSFVPTDTSPLFFLHQITIQDGTLLAVGMHLQFSDDHGIFTSIDRFSSWISDYFVNCIFFISIPFSMIDLNNCSVDELAPQVNV